MCFYYSAGAGGQLEVFGVPSPPPFGGLGGTSNEPRQPENPKISRRAREG
jgi:hypothetical protein